jgi:hypothetical protein
MTNDIYEKSLIRIDIPIKTISESNHSGQNRFVQSKRHKNQKNAVKLCISGAVRQRLLSHNLPLTFHLMRIAPRKFDKDNLVSSFKYIRDAIAEIIFPSLAPGRADDSNQLCWIYDQEKGNTGEYKVVVIVYAGILEK